MLTSSFWQNFLDIDCSWYEAFLSRKHDIWSIDTEIWFWEYTQTDRWTVLTNAERVLDVNLILLICFSRKFSLLITSAAYIQMHSRVILSQRQTLWTMIRLLLRNLGSCCSRLWGIIQGVIRKFAENSCHFYIVWPIELELQHIILQHICSWYVITCVMLVVYARYSCRQGNAI